MITIATILGTIMIFGAVAVLFSKTLKLAAVIFGIVSLSASIMFFLMKAPDVAITEASIGAVLSTAVFFFAIRRIEEIEEKDKE